MSVEDCFYHWLGKYLDAPQWVKTPLGLAYAILPKLIRYGSDYRRFFAEAQLDDPRQVNALAEVRLRSALMWAAQTVPAYAPVRALLRDGASVTECLLAFPLTSRSDLQARPQDYISRARPERARLSMQTGGSLPESLSFFLERGVSRCKEAAYIDSFRRRLGPGGQGVILSLRGCIGSGAERGATRSFEPIRQILAISPKHLDAACMSGHMEAAIRHRVSLVQGYPSAVYLLACWLRDNAPASGLLSGIRGVQLFSETIQPFMVETIREVFQCPVLFHYGHAERAVMAGSMPDDPRYFVWPLYGKVELVGADGAVINEPGQVGEIVATGFDNRVMPFVRYRTGDMACWSAGPAHRQLPGFPVLERIEGQVSGFHEPLDEAGRAEPGAPRRAAGMLRNIARHVVAADEVHAHA
jgi:phenylacetate-CoA ligase